MLAKSCIKTGSGETYIHGDSYIKLDAMLQTEDVPLSQSPPGMRVSGLGIFLMSAAEMVSGSKMAVLEFSLFVNQIITEIVKLGGHGINAVGGGFISVVLPDGV